MNPRRLVARIRQLEWPAVGVELVIVILGVFIGLQVSNWNVERDARQRGALFAERLRADLQEEAWYYQLQIEYIRDVLVSTGTLGLIESQVLRNSALRVYNVPTLENVAREGMQSPYREAFRMALPNDVQRALARNCGDRYVRAGDYAGLDELIDYPCQTGLPTDVIDEAARTLRSNATLVPLLRLRIADLETRLVDLTGNNKDVLQGLQAIANQ